MVLEVIFHTSRFLHPIIVKMTIIFNQHLDKNQTVLITNPQNKNTTKNDRAFIDIGLCVVWVTQNNRLITVRTC